MRSWPAPKLPLLPVATDPPVIQLHNTATERREVSMGVGDSSVRLYVCGLTPYDAAHLGHAATYLAFDVLQRQWRDAGLQVHYTQNVTDVDDPLLERAQTTGIDWRQLADEQIQVFRDDMSALRVLPPDAYVGVVESMDQIIVAVQQLEAAGHAYRVPSPDAVRGEDVYLSIHDDPRFGAVSHLDEPQMLAIFAERGGDPARPGKRHPLDALLWRAHRDGEPQWDGGPLGHGRPGWHIECAVISHQHLGTVDVQAGGTDLIFPHHEMSAVHGELLTGRQPFAHQYAHAAMVGLDGEKMSKSKGNLVFVHELLDRGVPAMVVRLAIAAHHYRTEWTWDDAQLPAAQARLRRWQQAAACSSGQPADQLRRDLRAALASDIDTPAALAVVDAWAESVLAQETPMVGDPIAREAADAIDALLGVDVTLP